MEAGPGNVLVTAVSGAGRGRPRPMVAEPGAVPQGRGTAKTFFDLEGRAIN